MGLFCRVLGLIGYFKLQKLGIEMSRMISILLPDLRGGGAERVNVDLAYQFSAAGHDVEFVLLQERGEFLQEVREHFPVTVLHRPRARNLLPALTRYLRKKQPDALLAAMWPLTVIGPLAGRMAGGVKVLVSEHGIISAQYGEWGVAHRLALRASVGLGYRLAEACIGVSDGVVRDMASLAWRKADRFHTIYNPVPPRPVPSETEASAAKAAWKKPYHRRILSVGRFKEVKNHALLLQAFALLADKNTSLLILGEGQLQSALEQLAAELGIADRVAFPGFHADPTPFYAAADLFVLSSNYEGFGNVIVEALACGTPVVSTDCPAGPAEILGSGRWGKLTPVGNAERLASAISATLSTPHDSETLKRRAADFAPDVAARQYLELLDAK
jgi:glycosyltransferase involved in cell wall biosynthesis